MTCDGQCPQTDRVQLEIDGRAIELNPFVQGFIARTVRGMVSSLRGVDKPESIRLEVRPDTDD